jgi:hypothetical protein
VVAEVVPGYQRKYDKVFIVGASDPKTSINVIRVEFVDAKGEAISRDKRVELQQSLTSIKDKMFCDRLSPGVEFIGRKICPILLEEEKQLGLPQVYMHPHSRSNIKVVVVTSGEDRGQAFRLIEEISKVKGLEAGMPDPVSVVASGTGEDATVQEMAIIDVWVDFENFFGKPKGPYNDELILVRIEKALRRANLIGPRVRIFDQTGRQFRRARSERISSIVRKRGYDPEIARQIVARLGDRLVVSPIVSDEEVLEQVLAGIDALQSWEDTGKATPAIAWRTAKAGPRGRGTSYTILAIVYSPDKAYLSDLVRAVASYGLEGSTVVDNTDSTMVILRLSHQDRSLEESEIIELSAELKHILR